MQRLSKGCIVVCVRSKSLRRLIALEVSSRGQGLQGAITTKQGTITLSYLNVAYNVDRTGRQPVARYLRSRVSLARTDCRTAVSPCERTLFYIYVLMKPFGVPCESVRVYFEKKKKKYRAFHILFQTDVKCWLILIWKMNF